MTEFEIPSFLEGQDADTIHKRMMESLPEDIDKTEAGFPYDFTKPTALEVAELLEFFLPETLKIMFPQFAYGKWLDLHAEQVGISRRNARNATGKVTVEGVSGIEIPKGFLFAVPSSGNVPAIEFVTTEDAIIGNGGSVDINVKAVEAGISGNVSANTISIMSVPISGITKINNSFQISGGTEEEDDDSLRARIDDINKNSNSFVGNDADYVRWAKEVNGVGNVMVIREWNGAGTVKVVVIDSNNSPANDSLIEDVYNHIVSPNNQYARLAPIGATVTVSAPVIVNIVVQCNIIFSIGNIDEITQRIKENIEKYLAESVDEHMVKYHKIAATIINTEGVADYDNLYVNNSIENIEISIGEFPTLKNLIIL